MSVPFTSHLLAIWFCQILSCTQVVGYFKYFLQHSAMQIPTFVGKIISNLCLIKRSNGDSYHYAIENCNSFEDFIKMFRNVLTTLTSIDYISVLPSLGGRFRSNEPLYNTLTILFNRLIGASSFLEIGEIIIGEFNFLSKTNTSIDSMSADCLFGWVITSSQDSRNYGYRNYRKGTSVNTVIFKSGIEINSIFCFLSILFVDYVCISRDTEVQILTVESMSDDVFCIDTSSNASKIVYLSQIVSFFNKPSSSRPLTSVGRKFTKNKASSVNSINKNPVLSSSVLNSEGAAPKGERGYSSIGTNSHLDYSCSFTSHNGVIVNVNFSTLKALNQFIDSRFSFVGKEVPKGRLNVK